MTPGAKHVGIAAVLFDLDDTLLDRRRSVEHYLLGHTERARLTPENAAAYCARFHELDENGHRPRAALFDQLAAEFPSIGTGNALLRDFLDHAFASCQFMEHAVDTLTWCRQADLRLGVITNGSSSMQRAKLRSLDLANVVDVILVSEEEGVSKPDAEIFRRAAARLGVHPEQCVFVGDNPEADVHGSRGIGMSDVWIRRHFDWPRQLAAPSHSIGALSELPAILRTSIPQRR